jgi:membrane-associated phospholipid phosphatase
MALKVAAGPMLAGAALWLFSGAVLVGLSVLLVDQPVSTWSHDVLHRPLLAVDVTTLANWKYPLCAACLVLVGAFASSIGGRPMGPLWRTAIAAAIATFLATLAVAFVKHGFGREWPETWINNNPSWISNHAYGFYPLHGGEGYDSFPSGHTARVTAPFAVLWRRLPKLRVLWVLPTLIIAAALIAANFHFVGDCIGGAYLGVACAAVVLVFMREGENEEDPLFERGSKNF